MGVVLDYEAAHVPRRLACAKLPARKAHDGYLGTTDGKVQDQKKFQIYPRKVARSMRCRLGTEVRSMFWNECRGDERQKVWSGFDLTQLGNFADA